jgi:poly-gamma-glutamate capsule biosynthesis protein CapA/YwtB (metallophosphatase superfamily)
VRPSRTIHLVACALLLAVASCSEPERAAGPPVRETTPTVSPTTPAGREGPGPRPLHEPLTTLTVVGDIMLGRGVAGQPGGAEARLRPMAGRLRAADLTVGNLESTLSDAGTPQQGTDSFHAPPAALDALAGAGIDALSLANNHTGDFGARALLETVAGFWGRHIQSFGAGRDLQAATRAVVLTRSGVRFGFLGFNAIGETPRATARTPGALSVRMPPRTGPLDRADLSHVVGAVRELGKRVDVVVVLPHWGTQYTHVAEPVQSLVGRRLVDAGADLVVGGHPHWVQGLERYDGAVIAHSLGNFVFDMDFMEQTMEGVILTATFRGDRLRGVELTPYRLDATFTPRPATGPGAQAILSDVHAHSIRPER